MSAVSWSWRAVRGHSVTFAALFACSLLGLSLIGELRQLLSWMQAPWYVWILLPMLAIGYLAKKESKWMPEVETRRKWSRRLVLGSVVVAVLVAVFSPNSDTPSPKAPHGASAPGR